jgi:hypothetical protein
MYYKRGLFLDRKPVFIRWEEMLLDQAILIGTNVFRQSLSYLNVYFCIILYRLNFMCQNYYKNIWYSTLCQLTLMPCDEGTSNYYYM